MARRYPQEVHDFIRENVVGTTTRTLAAMVNERFGEELFTESAMKSYKANHRLKSGTPCGMPKDHASAVFPQPVVDYIRANYKGVGNKEMAERLNELFGTSYTTKQLNSYYKNHGLNCGLTGRFEKGNVPPNKGRKGYCAPGSEKGHFKKGHTPMNKLPIGTVLTKSDGYLWRKVGQGAREWRQEHLIVWEAAHGPVPKGSVIIFLDGNVKNVSINNLACVTKAENARLNQSKLRSSNPRITEVGIAVAKLKTATARAARQRRTT